MGDSGAICGKIVSSSGEPLRKAEVTASSFENHTEYISLTGSDGLFAFDALQPGQYHLRARRAGYVPAAYGTQDEMFPGTPVTVTPGREIRDIVIALQPQSVITGRVLDEDGDPLEGVHVNLLREADFGHGNQLVPRSGSPAASDDEGNFRIAAIAPGTYFLSASFGRTVRHHGNRIQQGPEETYPDLYYPDVLEPDEAQPIRVAPATRLGGFELRLKKARAYHVRGRIELPPDADPHSVSLHLDPRRSGRWIIMGGGGHRMLRGSETFDIGGVLPGPYTLRTSCSEACTSRQAQLDVDVADRDVEGLVLRFPEGAEVRGIVRGPGVGGGIHVSLAGRETRMQSAGATTLRDGTFTLQQVTPGTYRVHLWEIPRGSYVKSVRYGGVDVTPVSVPMPDPASGAVLEVEVAADGAVLSGVVEDAAGKPHPGAAVRLWAGPDESEISGFAITDQDGRFEIRGIAPGEYCILAGESMRVRPSPEGATPLALAAGEHRTLTLRLNAVQ